MCVRQLIEFTLEFIWCLVLERSTGVKFKMVERNKANGFAVFFFKSSSILDRVTNNPPPHTHTWTIMLIFMKSNFFALQFDMIKMKWRGLIFLFTCLMMQKLVCKYNSFCASLKSLTQGCKFLCKFLYKIYKLQSLKQHCK